MKDRTFSLIFNLFEGSTMNNIWLVNYNIIIVIQCTECIINYDYNKH